MGQRLAPALAIAFMSKIETPILERKPLLYCRYIDDCFIVCASQDEMDLCFDLLNSQAENIKHTREKSTGRWLTYLNVQVNLARGKFHTRWYRKPTSKNTIVHFRSARPSQTKKAVVKNMFRTATMVSSNCDLKSESWQLSNCIAIENGYPDQNMPRVIRPPAVNTPVHSLPNWKGGRLHGFGSGVPHKVHGLQREYIGETGRPLGERAKEHVDTLRRCDISEPLG
ncbi:unnamed protein product [Nippostrongylus brasiliensis]|uniref:Reverse transcriptase domain-containing protein n=1 Tax=Nippostrongylus brasiliensis TaxID=27835 RepID=A0A0N4Y435_NIPBR|nr:unnamed protein product [Nippostrongylus brasiliensis]